MRSTALAQHSSLSEMTQSEMGSRPPSPTEWKSWVPERLGRRSFWQFILREQHEELNMLLGQNKLLLLFLQVWHGKDFTAMTPQTSQSQLLYKVTPAHSASAWIVYARRRGWISLFLSPSHAAVALGWLLHAPDGAPEAQHLGLCWVLSQSWSVTPLHWPLLPTLLPGFTAVYQAAPASLRFTDSLSLISVFYLFLWEAAGYEEPRLLFCSPELDFLGHISDLKLLVGERIGHAGYLAFLLRRHTFPGIFC